MATKKKLEDLNLIAGQIGNQIDPNRVIKGHLDDFTNTLKFHRSTGEVIYVDKSGNTHKGHFSPRGNGYLLLAYLTENPREVYSAGDIAKVLNTQRKSLFNSFFSHFFPKFF